MKKKVNESVKNSKDVKHLKVRALKFDASIKFAIEKS